VGVKQEPSAELGDLYARYHLKLRRALVVAGAPAATAEDLVQDTFTRLIPNWPQVRHYDSPEGWLFTAAMRLWLSHQRRALLFGVRSRLLTPTGAAVGSDPAEQVALDDAIGRLSVDHRVIIALFYLADLPVEAIATALDVPPGTVKSRLARAREQLATALSATEGSPG
jgi:DNA-directed RNA polymerase specialized sigma24 family protein